MLDGLVRTVGVRTRRIAGWLAMGLLVYASLTLLIPPLARESVTFATPFPGALFGTWWCARAFRQSRTAGDRGVLGWALLTASCLFSAIGAIVSAVQSLHGSPFVGNAVFSLGVVLLACGIGVLGYQSNRIGFRTTLDVAVIAFSGTMALWLVLLPSRSLNHTAHLTDVLFGAIDVGLLFSCALALEGAGDSDGAQRSAVYVAFGGIAFLVGEASYTVAHIFGHNISGLLIDVPWVVSPFLIGIGAMWAYDSQVPETQDRVVSRIAWSLAVLVSPLIAILGLLVSDYAKDRLFEPRTLGVCAVLVGVYVLRQSVALGATNRVLRDNQAIQDRMIRFNEGLEAIVRERTRHLETLQALTAAAQSTLREADALRICCEGALRALEADGCGVWTGSEEIPTFSTSAVPSGSVRDRVRHIQRYGCDSPDAQASRLHILAGSIPSDSISPSWLIVWRTPNPFTETEQTLARSVSSELGSALRNARLHAAAEAAAETDPVTGLLNNKVIQTRLHQEISRSQREGKPLSVVMMDLDDFKIFNDAFGHPVGDEVLRHVGRVMRKNTREFDLLARYGGDEFAAVLPGADSTTAGRIVDRVRSTLDEGGFRHNNEEVPLRMSFGLATYPDDALSATDLLAHADANLYAAKRRRGAHSTPDAPQPHLANLAGFATLDALISAVDNRDHYTRRHAEEVAGIAVAMASELKWSLEDITTLRAAALVHNVGKIGVAEFILRKPGKLSEAEFEAMERHAEIGNLLVRATDAPLMVSEVAYSHHERWDGTGYPRRLSGESIPCAARLVAVTDAYCAMTTHRPYRRAMSPELALQVLHQGAGTQWDPQMVNIFTHVWALQQGEAPASGNHREPAPEPLSAQSVRRSQ